MNERTVGKQTVGQRPSEYYRQLTEVLRAALGDPDDLHRSSPLFYTETALEVLLATILTQATSDKNALQAWLAFKKAYTGPEQVLQTSEIVLSSIISSGGLGRQKSKTIRAVLGEVQAKLGEEYSLASLKDDPQWAWTFLNQLPGIGPKTAACTMLFGLGLPYFPVDVHIHRIAKRLKWVSGPVEPAVLQQYLSHQIPAEFQQDLHILLLNLGRRYCRPQHPDCTLCPLKQCPRQF
jgi:endonuclease III